MIYLKRKTVFKIGYFRFILNYPNTFHDHVTLNLGLTLQNQYGLRKGILLVMYRQIILTFVTGQKKSLMDTHMLSCLFWKPIIIKWGSDKKWRRYHPDNISSFEVYLHFLRLRSRTYNSKVNNWKRPKIELRLDFISLLVTLKYL